MKCSMEHYPGGMIISVYISYHIVFGGKSYIVSLQSQQQGDQDCATVVLLHHIELLYHIFHIYISTLTHSLLLSTHCLSLWYGVQRPLLAFHIFMMCVCCTAAPCFVTLAQISYMYENTERYEVNNRKMEVCLPLLNSMLLLRKKVPQLFTVK